MVLKADGGGIVFSSFVLDEYAIRELDIRPAGSGNTADVGAAMSEGNPRNFSGSPIEKHKEDAPRELTVDGHASGYSCLAAKMNSRRHD